MTWVYQNLLNSALQAIFILGLGYLVGLQIPKQTDTIQKGLALFLNKICIPTMIFWAVGIKLDLTNSENWKFASAFIIQTAIFIIIITVQIVVGMQRGRGKGEVWAQKFGAQLVTSAGMLGPLALEGALGKEYVPLAFLTAFNTFVLQLPLLQLVLEKFQNFDQEESSPIAQQSTYQKVQQNLEYFDDDLRHSGEISEFDSEKNYDQNQKSRQRKSLEAFQIQNRRKSLGQLPEFDSANKYDQNQKSRQRKSLELTRPNFHIVNLKNDQEILIDFEDHLNQNNEVSILTIQRRFFFRNINIKENCAQILLFIKDIFWRLIQTPMIWAIIAGIISSTTGLRKFLDPKNSNFISEIFWIESTFHALGACLTPVALVLTGLWISQNKIFQSCNFYTVIFDLFFKFVIVPFSMILIAMILGLEGDLAKASVILSAMPMALVVIPMAQQYSIAINEFTVNLVLGLILMFPCIIVIMELMNYYGIFYQQIVL